jgi:hypothetical protein
LTLLARADYNNLNFLDLPLLDAKGRSLILLAFFFPLAIYLLVLGNINQRRRPVLVSGTLDFIGVLFAASGFLLLGGPAVLSRLSEVLRQLWLKDEAGASASETWWQVWLFVSACYFLAVVSLAGLLLWRRRRLTSIYNVEPAMVEYALGRVCEHLGLNPVRTGNLYLFGVTLGTAEGTATRGEKVEAITTLSHEGEALGIRKDLSLPHLAAPAPLLPGTAVLEVDTFAAMRHTTLCWEPADSALRREVEAELDRMLSTSYAPPSELGAWLSLLGLVMLSLIFLGGVVLVLIRVLGR